MTRTWRSDGDLALWAHTALKKWILTQRRPPIFISAISFGNPWDQFHIMALLPTGYWRQRVVTIREIFKLFSKFRRILPAALPWRPSPGPSHYAIWHERFIDLVSDFLTGSPALLLAVKPALAEVPWQNLLMRYRNDLVVSMVPNLSYGCSRPIGSHKVG